MKIKPFDFKAGEAAERQTVVLLHSSASASRQWNALDQLLRTRCGVRTVDFHGDGAHAAWPGARPLTLADEAALVEPILRETGSVHLVGHSYGGAVVLKVAELPPQSVRSLVIYEPVLCHEQPSPQSAGVARAWSSVGRAMQAKSPLLIEIFALGALKARLTSTGIAPATSGVHPADEGPRDQMTPKSGHRQCASRSLI